MIDYKKKDSHNHHRCHHYHHRHCHHYIPEKRHSIDQSEQLQASFSVETMERDKFNEVLPKKPKAALRKLEHIKNNALYQSEESQRAIRVVAPASSRPCTTAIQTAQTSKNKSQTKPVSKKTSSEKTTTPVSSDVDTEDESMEKKRQRQRSLVLNLGRIHS